jgi:hypothetical protein
VIREKTRTLRAHGESHGHRGTEAKEALIDAGYAELDLTGSRLGQRHVNSRSRKSRPELIRH